MLKLPVCITVGMLRLEKITYVCLDIVLHTFPVEQLGYLINSGINTTVTSMRC